MQQRVVLDHYMEPIVALLEEKDISEVMVNNYEEIFIERKGVFEKVDKVFPSEHDVAQLIKQVASLSGSTEASENRDPVVNARLPDGSRFCGILAPWSPRGSSFSIRKFPDEILTIEELKGFGSMTGEMTAYLRKIMTARLNIIVSGSTSSGKTTLLNALGGYVDPEERVISVEDTEEINFKHVKNWLPLVSHNRKMDEGAQEVSLSFFITTALRLNPDRIFVGEVRESSAATAFIRAINTGHDGCVTTIHANGPEDAMHRLVGEVLATGVPLSYAEQQVWRNIHVVVQAKKIPGVGRKVTSISEIVGSEVIEMFAYDTAQQKHVRYDDNLKKSCLKK